MVSLRGMHRAIAVVPEGMGTGHLSPYFFCVRESVARRLVSAADHLPRGLVILLREGYRTAARQRRLFLEAFLRLQTHHPEKESSEIYFLTCQSVAPVETAGHPTGGAVDISLVGEERLPIWRADEEEALLEKDWREERNSLLRKAMEEAGFVNYPGSIQHWSYGDRYWAFVTGRDALYETVEEDSLSFGAIRLPARVQ